MLVPGPLHPYGIQRMMKLWGKDHVVNVEQRANLYKTIRRLHESGLIAVRQTERDHQYPERTVYELTDEGKQQAGIWLADMLATARNEFPQFPAALSFVMGLPPDEVGGALEQRAAALRQKLAGIEQMLASEGGRLPRVTLLDDEYLRVITAAELNWIEGVLRDLRSGALTWNREMLAGLALETMTPLAADLTPEYISGYDQPPAGPAPS